MALERYNRHSLIDWFSQDYLRNAKIAVIGCGATGNEVGKNLALLGVGEIDFYDFDKIEITNLTRSVLFRESDIGRNKAEVVAERAKELDPNIRTHAYHGDFWENLKVSKLKLYNSVICCVDNFEARIKLNRLCFLLSVDLVNTGIDSKYSTVEVFPFSAGHDTSCYECNLPTSVYDRIRKRYSCGWLKKVSFVEKKIPTTILTSSISGAIATSISLRLESNKGKQGSRRILSDSITGIGSSVNLSKNPTCPACYIDSKNIVTINSGRKIEELITRKQSEVDEQVSIVTSEPILTKYRCVNCSPSELEATVVFEIASKFDSSITKCNSCQSDSVKVDIQDSFSIVDLIDNYRGRYFPCKYLISEFNDTILFFNLEE